ncbi:MAG: S8 family serine peptidase [Chloroflexi bacterium]|nr:S8 family serine peptidase [Chloroflexota bacterium]
MNVTTDPSPDKPRINPRRRRATAGAACVALLLWLAGVWGVSLPATSAMPPAKPLPAHSELLLVGLAPSISPEEADRLFADADLAAVRHWPEFSLAAARLAATDDSRSQDEALAAARALLVQQPGVRYVESDWAIEAAGHTSPNDPYFPEQWALAKINMPAAWDATVGDPTLIVALIDSGLGIAHEDLAGISLWTNEPELNGLAGEDDDGNGYVDDFHGWDWVGSVNTFADPYGHGTHVGGILTAHTNNGIGVASVGRNLTVMLLRVLDERGSGFISYLVDALSYARRKGAAIVNLSLVLRIDSLAVADSVRAFAATGGLIVAATGNYGSQVYWPAAYTETIAVAATSMDDSRSAFSNRGPQTDLAAPGSLIVSTYLNNSYYLNDGTSMAVPHVSALAALVWSLRPDWNWVQVKNHLMATAVDVNANTLPGPDDDIGYGRIDAQAALTQAGAGISFTVDYLAGQYTSVDQPLRIPIQLAVTKTNGEMLPVVGALIHYELLGSPEIGSGESVPSPVLSGTLTSSVTGRTLLDMRTPERVGRYELRIRMAGHARSYPITLQDGPLVLSAESSRSVLTVGGEQTDLLLSAHTGDQGELLQEPLMVELTTSLGVFSDGSRQRTLWMTNGLLTETLTGGTVAGIAEIGMSAAGQTQRAFVTVQPGPTQRISGPTRLFVQDWGNGATATIRLKLRDRYGNLIWNNRQVNFYTLRSTFAPQSPAVVLGKVETQLALPVWLPPTVEYWAMVPGTFSTFQGEVVILRHHLWLPRVGGTGGLGRGRGD